MSFTPRGRVVCHGQQVAQGFKLGPQPLLFLQWDSDDGTYLLELS